ncbi:MAG: hypothetical protein K0S27_870 [Gammaproteobacteria bacterium]|jgi:hypothetical protein|nr:hypothetical protein [Gammaproteobacteria bacterium]
MIFATHGRAAIFTLTQYLSTGIFNIRRILILFAAHNLCVIHLHLYSQIFLVPREGHQAVE